MNHTAFKNFEQKYLGKLINRYQKNDDESINVFFEIINKYILLHILTFLISLFYYTWVLGFTAVNIAQIIFIIYSSVLYSFKKNIYLLGIYFKTHTLIYYFMIIGFSAFCNIATNNLFKIEYHYFPILSSIPFIINLKTEKKYILIVCIAVLIAFIAPLFFEFSFIPRLQAEMLNTNTIRAFIAGEIILILGYSFVNIYFVYEKDMSLQQIKTEKYSLENNLIELEDSYSLLLKNQFNKNGISQNDIIEIRKLAEINSPLYFEKFCKLFPNFKESILAIDSTISLNDLQFLSLMKLNFDTKKIAQVKNISVRAVESKKYRLKKKLRIQSNTTIHEYILLL